MGRNATIRCALLAACAALLGGCGGDDSGPGAASGGSGGTAGTGGSAGNAGSGGTAGAAGSGGCGDPRGLGTQGSCVEKVSGKVVDASGAPLKLDVSVCGPVCFYGESATDGSYVVDVNQLITPDDYSALPHGRPDRTSFHWKLPTGASGSVALPDLLVLDLPAAGPPLVVKSDQAGAPAQNVVSGDVTLDVAQGVVVKIDVEDIALGAQGKQFRTLTVPKQHHAAFVDASLSVLALYALTPFEASIQKEGTNEPALATLSFDNTTGLGAGTAVEFLALGSYLFADWVNPATFEVVATGTVSSDGLRVNMDPGQGISYLTWVGIREKK